jgi:processive 1,2-diacylglycerol beta-glucosyltransferase
MVEKTKKILVLTDHMPWGHRSIAKAIFGMIKKDSGFEVKYIAYNSGLNLWNFWYTLTYRFFPRLGKIYFKLSNNKVIVKLMERGYRVRIPALKKLMEKEKPDVVICTYNVFNQILSRIKDRKFKLIVVVADPWKTYDISFAKGADCHLVYDEKMKQKAIEMGIEKDKILVTGWWVREEMYKKYKKEESNKPVIFVGGGSLGNSALPKILWIIINLNKPVKFIISTGTDKFSYFLALICKKIIKWLNKDKLIEIDVHGWIEDVAGFLSKSDIVLGKGGPNFIFECVAQEKPFVMISHIGGQEDGNVDLVLEKKLGWVKEKFVDLIFFLNDYLDDFSKYNTMYEENIRKESFKNKKPHQKLVSIVASPYKKTWWKTTSKVNDQRRRVFH